jgi:DNA-binding transcriptional regulator YiaG
MTAQDLDSLLDRLGLSRTEAARLVGRDVRTIRRWLSGDRIMSDADAAILLMLDRGHVSKRRVLSAIKGAI